MNASSQHPGECHQHSGADGDAQHVVVDPPGLHPLQAAPARQGDSRDPVDQPVDHVAIEQAPQRRQRAAPRGPPPSPRRRPGAGPPRPPPGRSPAPGARTAPGTARRSTAGATAPGAGSRPGCARRPAGPRCGRDPGTAPGPRAQPASDASHPQRLQQQRQRGARADRRRTGRMRLPQRRATGTPPAADGRPRPRASPAPPPPPPTPPPAPAAAPA